MEDPVKLKFSVKNYIDNNTLNNKLHNNPLKNFQISSLQSKINSFKVTIHKQIDNSFESIKKTNKNIKILEQFKYALEIDKKLISLTGTLEIEHDSINLNYMLVKDEYFVSLLELLMFYVVELFQYLLSKPITPNDIIIVEE